MRISAPLLDLAGISTEFSGAITTQFCFSYSPGGVTAMPRGLPARCCDAFLVVLVTLLVHVSNCTISTVCNNRIVVHSPSSVIRDPRYTRTYPPAPVAHSE